MKTTIRAIIVLAGCALTVGAGAADPGNHEAATKSDVARATAPQFSPYVGRTYPTRVFWGDTHLHTSISVDAGTMNRVGPGRRFPIRTRRGSHEHRRAARQALATARFPRDRRPRGNVRAHAAVAQRRPRDSRHRHRQEVARGADVGQHRHDLRHGDGDRRFAVGRRGADQERQGGAQRLAGLHRAGGQVQRARPLHRADRLRMDRNRRRQPASQRGVPRQFERGEPHPAVLAVRQQEPRGSLALPGRLRATQRGGRAGDPAQRQPQQRPHVHGRDVRRQAADERTGGAARAVRAGHRGDPDQGRQRDRTRTSRRATSSRTTRSGTGRT